MKASELMIGDLVQIVEPSKYAGAIGYIKTLIDHKDDENAYFRVFLRNNTIHIGIEDICSEDIRPIHLTPKILEKNGFEYKEPILPTISEEKIWQIEDSNEQILIELEEQTDDNLVDFYVGRFICGCNNCELFIKHIHQLQHALKLLGIKKSIEL